jgi:hypothetical protein
VRRSDLIPPAHVTQQRVDDLCRLHVTCVHFLRATATPSVVCFSMLFLPVKRPSHASKHTHMSHVHLAYTPHPRPSPPTREVSASPSSCHGLANVYPGHPYEAFTHVCFLLPLPPLFPGVCLPLQLVPVCPRSPEGLMRRGPAGGAGGCRSTPGQAQRAGRWWVGPCVCACRGDLQLWCICSCSSAVLFVGLHCLSLSAADCCIVAPEVASSAHL